MAVKKKTAYEEALEKYQKSGGNIANKTSNIIQKQNDQIVKKNVLDGSGAKTGSAYDQAVKNYMNSSGRIKDKTSEILKRQAYQKKIQSQIGMNLNNGLNKSVGYFRKNINTNVNPDGSRDYVNAPFDYGTQNTEKQNTVQNILDRVNEKMSVKIDKIGSRLPNADAIVANGAVSDVGTLSQQNKTMNDWEEYLNNPINYGAGPIATGDSLRKNLDMAMQKKVVSSYQETPEVNLDEKLGQLQPWQAKTTAEWKSEIKAIQQKGIIASASGDGTNTDISERAKQASEYLALSEQYGKEQKYGLTREGFNNIFGAEAAYLKQEAGFSLTADEQSRIAWAESVGGRDLLPEVLAGFNAVLGTDYRIEDAGMLNQITEREYQSEANTQYKTNSQIEALIKERDNIDTPRYRKEEIDDQLSEMYEELGISEDTMKLNQSSGGVNTGADAYSNVTAQRAADYRGERSKAVQAVLDSSDLANGSEAQRMAWSTQYGQELTKVKEEVEGLKRQISLMDGLEGDRAGKMKEEYQDRLELAEKDLKALQYYGVMFNRDFGKNSGYNLETAKKSAWYQVMNTGDIENAKRNLTGGKLDQDFIDAFDMYGKYLSDSDKAVFNYLYATQGAEAASKFSDIMTNKVQYQETKAESEERKKWAKASPWLSTMEAVISELPASVLGTIGAMVGSNPYSELFRYTRAHDEIISAVSEDMGTLGQILYNAAVGVAEQIMWTAVASGGSVTNLLNGGSKLGQLFHTAGMSAMGAASSAYGTLVNGGASTESQLKFLTSFATEFTTETIGFDRIMSGFQAGMVKGTSWSKLLKGFVASAIPEGLEEIPGQIIDPLVDDWLMGVNSDRNTLIRSLMESDPTMSFDEAVRKADGEWLKETVMAFASAGISGGVSGASAQAYGAIYGHVNSMNYAKDMEAMFPGVKKRAKKYSKMAYGLTTQDKAFMKEYEADMDVKVKESEKDPLDTIGSVTGNVESEDGKSGKKHTAVKLNGISFKNGKPQVKVTENGRTGYTDFSAVSFGSDGMSYLYNHAAQFDTEEEANQYLAGYKDSEGAMTPSVYNKAFMALLEAKQNGTSVDKAEKVWVDMMTPGAKFIAEQMGENRTAEMEKRFGMSEEQQTDLGHRIDTLPKAADKNYSGVVLNLKEGTRLNTNQKIQIALIDDYAKENGLNVTVLEDENQQGQGASLDEKHIRLSLNAQGGLMTAVFGHEAWHTIKKWVKTSTAENQGMVQELESYLESKLNADDGYNMEYRIESMKTRNKGVFDSILSGKEYNGKTAEEKEQIRTDMAREEIFANAVGFVLSQKANVEEAVTKFGTTFGEKIKSFCQSFLDFAKRALKRLGVVNPEARTVLKMEQDEIQHVYDSFEKVLAARQGKAQIEQKRAVMDANDVGETKLSQKESESIAQRVNESDLRAEYAFAVASGNVARAEQILAEKADVTEGSVAYKAVHGHAGPHTVISRMIKVGDDEAVSKAADDMAAHVPENAMLIPMPPHTGKVLEDTDTFILSQAISNRTGAQVAVALEGYARESRYQNKVAGKKENVSADQMGFRQVMEIPEGMTPVFVDNVVGTGETAKAAKNAIGRGFTLAYAKGTRSKPITGLKDVSAITYDDDGNLVPLEKRIDVTNSSVKYSLKAIDDKYFTAVKNLHDYDDLEGINELVRNYAELSNYTSAAYHGTLNKSFNVFNREFTHPGGNSGAGFYFSSSIKDATSNYSDQSGEDNKIKIENLSNIILSNGIFKGEKVNSKSESDDIARKELNKKPGVYNVYLDLKRSYIRDFDESTNLYDDLMEEYDVSQEEDEEDYLRDKLKSIVVKSLDELNDEYKFESGEASDYYDDFDGSIDKILDETYFEKRITWDTLENSIGFNAPYIKPTSESDEIMSDSGTELTRLFIKNLGYNSVTDKEASKKFGQLRRMGETGTIHYIVFEPSQIKSADPITYDDNGDVVPLSERFNSDNDDIRYSVKDMEEPALQINDRTFPFTEKIFSDDPKYRKTIETRFYPPSEDAIGKKIGIIKTGKGKAQLVGYATLAGVKEYKSVEEFNADYDYHFVDPHSAFAMREDKPKYGWILKDPVKLDKPEEIGKYGFNGNRVWRDIKGYEKVSGTENVYADEETRSAYASTGHALLSQKTYQDSEYVTNREKAVQQLVDHTGRTREECLKWLENIDGVADRIIQDRERLDYDSAVGRSSFKSNSEYGGSIDFSTLCPKRQVQTGTIDAIQMAMPEFAMSQNDFLKIRKMLQEKGETVGCGLCYVESTRKNLATFASQFIAQYQEKNPDVKLDMTDVNTIYGLETLRMERPEIYQAYIKFMNKLAQRKPKLFETRTAYDSEILNAFKNSDKVSDKNLAGGLRINSFSDFEMVHLIDMMQVLTDMTSVGLAGQGYTKVKEFARTFGGTGLKINMSMIAKGVDENGEIIFDEVEGMKWSDVEKVRNGDLTDDPEMKKAYQDNVGTILVVFNDDQLYAAMNDDRIDYIIPFHRSQWTKADYEKIGLSKDTKDFTNFQNETWLKRNAKGVYGRSGSFVDAEKAALQEQKKTVKRVSNIAPNSYWDFSKTGKENAERYLQLCAEMGTVPKFNTLLKDNRNGTWSLKEDGSTDGYWKLLTDFKMYNSVTGEGAPQIPVNANINMTEAYDILDTYQGGHKSFPVNQEVVEDFVRQNTKGLKRNGSQITLDPVAALNSLKETYSDDRLDKVVEENEQLKEIIRLMQISVGNEKASIVMPDVRKIAKNLLKTYNSGMDLETLTNQLRTVYSVLSVAKSGEDVYDSGLYAMIAVAKNLIMSSKAIDDEQYKQYKEFRSVLRKSKFRLSKQEMAEGISIYGSKKAFRNAVFGKWNISETAGNSLTDRATWDELCSLYPGLDQDAGEGDNVRQILDALDNTDIKYADNPYLKDIDYYAVVTGTDMLKQAISEGVVADNLPLAKEKADDVRGTLNQTMLENERLKKENQLLHSMMNEDSEAIYEELENARARAGEYQDENEELRGQAQDVQDKESENVRLQAENRRLQEDNDAMRRELAERGPQMDELKAKLAEIHRIDDERYEKRKMKDAQYATVKGAIDAFKEKQLNTFKRQEARRDIIRNTERIKKKLEAPRQGAFVPQSMINAVNALLENIDNAKNPGVVLHAEDLKKAKEAYMQLNPMYGNKNEFAGKANAFYNEDLVGDFDMLIRDSDGAKASRLDLKHLEAIRNIVAGFQAAITNEDRLFMDKRKMALSDVADKMIQHAGKRKQHGSQGSLTGMFMDAAARGLLKPVTVFHYFDGTPIEGIFKALRNAENQHVRQITEASQYLDGMVGLYGQQESIDAETSKKKTIEKQKEVILSSGKSVMLTDQELMSIYAYSKREPLVGTNHLTGKNGGIRLMPKGKGEYVGKYSLTEHDVKRMVDLLTQDQKDYVDNMVKFLSTTTSEWGNRVSMELYGIRKFEESYYFPFSVDRNALTEEPGEARDQRLKNGSMTKSITKGAQNALLIRPFTEVWCEHVEKMSDYAAFALPIEDVNRMMNYHDSDNNMRDVITRAYGKQTVDYIRSFLSRLNGNSKREFGAGLLNRFIGAAKGASVTFNLSVAIQQAGAGVRAMSEINPIYYAQGMAKGLHYKRSYAQLARHAPIAVLKGWGYFDTQNLRGMYQRQQNGWKNKLNDIGGFLAGQGDELNWAQTWEAVKAEIKATEKKYIFGSDAYFKRCAERFMEVVDKTQVVDSIFQRSEFATEKGLMSKLMAFMSEPVTMYNMVYRKIYDAVDAIQNGTKADVQKAAMGFGRTMAAIGFSSLLTAALKGFVSALRDRDDKKKDDEGNIIGVRGYWDKYAESIGENFTDNMLGIFTIFKSIYDEAAGSGSGSDLGIQWLNNAVAVTKEVTGLLQGKEADWDRIAYKALSAAGSLTGIGAGSLYRDAKSIILTGLNEINSGDLAGAAWDVNRSLDERLNAAAKNYCYKKSESTGNRTQNPGLFTDLMMVGYQLDGGMMGENFEKAAEVSLGLGAKVDGLVDAFKKKLAASDERVDLAAEALADGDEITYDRLVKEMHDDGMSISLINSMVKTSYSKIEDSGQEEDDTEQAPESSADLVSKLSEEKKQTTSTDPKMYKAKNDLFVSIDEGKSDGITKAVETLVKSGQEKSSIMSSITSEYKDKYLALNAGTAEKVKMRNALIIAYKACGMTAEKAEKKINDWSK